MVGTSTQSTASLHPFGFRRSFLRTVTLTRRVPDPGGLLSKVSRRAELCATISDHPRPSDPQPPCSRSRPRRTCARPEYFDTGVSAIAIDSYATARAARRPAQPLAPLHTPKILCALRLFPRVWGQFTVSPPRKRSPCSMDSTRPTLRRQDLTTSRGMSIITTFPFIALSAAHIQTAVCVKRGSERDM
ncbi:hypothetical protein EDB84DRAFT_1193414 [Lactarius hengduanensis]|nr:hypothetical protein EDB84DRAFT_1193414 [Lactarius hengduanensis]